MNVTPINPPSSKKRLCLLAIGLFAISNSVRADYTVIPDDLLPTAVIDARYAQPTQRFAVQFAKGRSALTEMGRNTLSTLIPIMNGSAIKIIGRPDASPAAKGGAAAIPNNRARNIRDYLTRQGIPYNSITIEIDNSPNPQQNGSNYPCEVFITRIDHSSQSPIGFSASVIANAPQQQQPFAPAQTYAPLLQRQQQQYAPVPIPIPAYSPQQQPQPQLQLQEVSRPYPAAAKIDASRDQLIQYINVAVQSGLMPPSVAIKMIRAAMMEETDKPFCQQPVRAPITQPIVSIEPPAPIVAVSKQVLTGQVDLTSVASLSKTWTVTVADTSVRLLLERWVKSAGYQLIWEIPVDLELNANATMSGSFEDALTSVLASLKNSEYPIEAMVYDNKLVRMVKRTPRNK